MKFSNIVPMVVLIMCLNQAWGNEGALNIENPRIAVEIDRQTGAIRSIRANTSQKQILAGLPHAGQEEIESLVETGALTDCDFLAKLMKIESNKALKATGKSAP